MLSAETASGVANLHDAFLNASLQRRAMDRSEVPTDAVAPDAADRFRFERTWIMFLEVLCEAWQAPANQDAVAFVRSAADTTALDGMVSDAASRSMARKVRSYMCHRDKRSYWDPGRSNAFGQLERFTQLHDAFGQVLLAGMRALNT